eukprot:12130286-Ditylum_brightwellii.AAC.1
MLVTKASHTMWKKNTVTLAPDLRVVVAVAVPLQAAATFQAIAALVLVLVLCQLTASKVMTITMWRTPTWAWMKE